MIKLFKLYKNAGTVSGSKVISGEIAKSRKCRIVRNEKILKDGLVIKGLRIRKTNVIEVNSGSECGIIFVDYTDLLPDDIIESYIEVKREQTFSFAPGVKYCD